MVGLWGIGVFSNDLTQFIIGDRYDKQQCAGRRRPTRTCNSSPWRFARPMDSSRQSKKSDHAAATCWAATLRTRQRRRAALHGGAGTRQRRARRLSPEASLAESCEAPTANRWPSSDEASRSRRRSLGHSRAFRDGSDLKTTCNRIVTRQKARNIEVLQWAAWTLICFNIGAFFGMYAFARVTQSIGRRPTFAIFFTLAMVATALAFGCMEKMPRDLWMVALMGGAQLSVFGGYAIYFPELFPTRLRSTGTSFCYNVGPLRICRRSAGTGRAEAGTGQAVRRSGACLPLGRSDDVLVFPGRARGAAVRAGDEGAAAAGIRIDGFQI